MRAGARGEKDRISTAGVDLRMQGFAGAWLRCDVGGEARYIEVLRPCEPHRRP